MPEENSNGKNPPPPESFHFKRDPVKCKRCHKEFPHFLREEIDNLVQLRCGDVLIVDVAMACLYCGSVFYWHGREKDFEKMALTYSQVLVKIGAYVPE